MRRLTTAELQTKAKMEMLMDKLKKKPKKSAEPLLVESIEESTITPVEAWPESPKTPTKHTKPVKVINTFENRHKTQLGIITEQKKRLQEQEEQIKQLLAAKVEKSTIEPKTETPKTPAKANLTKSPKSTCISSIIKPHHTVVNMQQREKERAERRKAAEERKKTKEMERLQKIKVKTIYFLSCVILAHGLDF